YQRLRRSISTMGISMIEAALAWGLRLAVTWTLPATASSLHGRRRVPATQAVAHADGEQVERDHDDQQQERRREHHGARGVDVRRLKADVVDVEAEVHELPVEVEKR